MSDRGLYQVGKRWYLRIAVHGRMQRFGKPHGFRTKEEARIFRDRLRESVRDRGQFPGQERTGDTLRELIAVYLDSIKDKKASYRDIARHLRFWADQIGDRPILSLHPSHISQGLAILRERCSGSTANHYAKSLRGMMRRTVKPFSWVLDFWRDVELFPVDDKVMPIYRPEDLLRVLEAATAKDALLIYLARLLGLRQGLFFALRWEWINWEQRMLRLPSYKRQKAFTLPLSTDALAILAQFSLEQSKPESGWIFPAPISGTTRCNPAVHRDPHNWYNRTFKPLLRGLGLGHLTFHALRHTWATALGERVPNRIVQILGNWSDMKMVSRYTHPHDESLRAGMEWVAESFRTAILLPGNKFDGSGKLAKLLKYKGKAV